MCFSLDVKECCSLFYTFRVFLIVDFWGVYLNFCLFFAVFLGEDADFCFQQKNNPASLNNQTPFLDYSSLIHLCISITGETISLLLHWICQ